MQITRTRETTLKTLLYFAEEPSFAIAHESLQRQIMPFHGHHHQSSSASANQPPSAASGLYHAAQALGSIGAPVGNLQVATSGMTTAGTDSFLPSNANASSQLGGGHTAPPMSSGLPGPGQSSSMSAPASAVARQPQHFTTPKRAQTFGRQPEELHMPSGNNSLAPNSPHQQSFSGQQQHHQSPQEYVSGRLPGINFQQATPNSGEFVDSPMGVNLPGALQPGNPGRPGPLSSNTAPSTVPTLPQLSSQSQQYTTPSRAVSINHTHNYSRSSPSGFDQPKYIPFTNTPENSKYASPTNPKYTLAHTPQGGASSSPLGLADIRPRADSGMSDSPAGANPYSYDGNASVPSNSNYLAPWALYAFDWCKWPIQQSSGSGAGKVAIGSYLEDGHNFVSTPYAQSLAILLLSMDFALHL